MAETTAFAQIVHLGRETVKTTFEYVGENETPLVNWFMKKPKMRLTERGYRIPIETRRPGGHTSYDRSNVDFRDPVSMETDSMRTYPIWYAMPFQIDGATLRELKSGDANSFISYRRYMKSITEAAMKRLEYYFHGDGSGALAVGSNAGVTSATTGLTLTCHSLASGAVGEAETKGTQRLEIGHSYAIIDASSFAINSIVTPTAIASKTSCTVTCTTYTATNASGDFLVDAGPTTATSAFRKVPMGLRGFCSASGILQNVSRSDYPELKTPRYNGSDAPITPYAFRFAKDLVRIAANDTNEANGRTIVMTPGQYGALVNQQFGYRRYNGNETVRGVANKYIDADGDTYLLCADGAEDRIYILDGGSYGMGEERPFGIFNEDGNEIRMLVGANSNGSDAFAGSLGWGGNTIKEGLPRMDAYIDRLSQTDVAQQVSV